MRNFALKSLLSLTHRLSKYHPTKLELSTQILNLVLVEVDISLSLAHSLPPPNPTKPPYP